MWFIVLIVLAIAAFFIIKAFKSRSDDQAGRLPDSGGQGPASPGTETGNPEAAGGSNGTQSTVQSGSASAANSPTATGHTATASGAAAAQPAASAAASSREVGPAGPDSGSVVALTELQSDDTLRDVREMIKVLNLRNSDASRLDIDKTQFDSIWAGDQSALSADELDALAGRLRHMLA